VTTETFLKTVKDSEQSHRQITTRVVR